MTEFGTDEAVSGSRRITASGVKRLRVLGAGGRIGG
jgi:hypothetical protein